MAQPPNPPGPSPPSLKMGLMQLQPAASEAEATPNTPTITVTDEKQHVAPLPEVTNEVPIKTHIALREPGPDETYDELSSLLRKYGRHHCDPAKKSFWPLGLLKVILTRERVLKALGSLECGGFNAVKSESYCKLIVPNKESLMMGGESLTQRPQSYMRVFAILLLSGRGKDIEIFVEHQICDQRLPLVNINNIIYTENRDLSEKEKEIQEFFKTCRMRSPDIDSFCNYQQGIMVHFFDLEKGNKVKHYNLSPNAMLPWLRPDKGHPEDNNDREGGYSLVKRYRIDSDSHGFHELLKSVLLHSGSVAVKILKKSKDPMAQIDWRREVNMLCRFNGLRHSSLITLLATYTQNDVHHLVFPCAQYDLEEYWTETPGLLVKPGHVDPESMRWVSKQIRGLMEALQIIHNPLQQDLDLSDLFGRHGDLKPENVLWFKSPTDIRGILVITDLGISEVHREVSRSNVPNKDIPRTLGYRPPECDIEKGKISRAFDIWTMGCLFLEKACWLLGGNVLRREFEEERYKPYLLTGAVTSIFFDIQKCGKSGNLVLMIKESVTKRLQDFHNHPGCTSFVHELLDLIQKEMIVVLSGSKVRARADVLLAKLDIMHRKAMDESQIDYITKDCPRDNPNIDVVAVEAIFNNTARERVDRMIHLGHKVTTFNGGVEKLTTSDFERVQGS